MSDPERVCWSIKSDRPCRKFCRGTFLPSPTPTTSLNSHQSALTYHPSRSFLALSCIAINRISHRFEIWPVSVSFFLVTHASYSGNHYRHFRNIQRLHIYWHHHQHRSIQRIYQVEGITITYEIFLIFLAALLPSRG